MRRGFWLVFLLIAGCAAPQPVQTRDLERVRALVIGDQGEGNQTQRQVAQAMAEVCGERGCDLVLALGDNFYPNGVDSPQDPQFQSKFEAIYDFPELDIPFFMTLGNHDDGAGGAGVQPARGWHQVAYSARVDRPSSRWQMPSRYYQVEQGIVDFFALDTNPLMFYGLIGPDQERADPRADPFGRAQLEWLEKGLAQSDADWKVAFGHHPYISPGQHGDAGQYEGIPGLGNQVKRFLEAGVCGEVDLYLAGHDHNLAWYPPQASCQTDLIVSGAAATPRPLERAGRYPTHLEVGNTAGFFHLDFGSRDLVVTAYNQKAEVIFEKTLTKP